MRIVYLISFILLLMSGVIFAQDDTPAPMPPVIPDSTQTDSTAVADSTEFEALIDSLFTGEDLEEKLPPLPPPVHFIDTLAEYFVRDWQTFDVQNHDLYPRDAAGFLYHNSSYFSQAYQETPQRTTISPFGLSGGQISVRSGNIVQRPYDRVVPADGRVDYSDFATGDVGRSGIIEGPLSVYGNTSSGYSTLYMEPFKIPDGPATSQFLVERGAFGYAYTRGRLARKFSDKLKISFSTDYRNGEGIRSNADDNSYYVKSRVVLQPFRATTVDVYLNVYRREGTFQVMPDSGGFVYSRLRREQQFVADITQHNIFGGQVSGRFGYQSSYSKYTSYSTDFFRTVLPHYYTFDLSYLRTCEDGIFELTAGIAKETFDINQTYFNRESAHLTVNTIRSIGGGKLFALARFKNYEFDHPAYDAVVGYARSLSDRFSTKASLGYIVNIPDVLDRYAPVRIGSIGSSGSLAGNIYEHGNVGLQPEKRLYGNLTLSYSGSKNNLTFSLNAGQIDNAIYYDQRYDVYTAGEIFPANDNIKFADANLKAQFESIGPFYGILSGTYRKVDSERYGNRPPYSPRWQTFGQVGIKHYIEKYDIYTRAFGELTYYDMPLSYRLDELTTGALINWGLNMSMQSFTFFYQMHNALSNYNETPAGYGYTGWFYSWGVNWKFID